MFARSSDKRKPPPQTSCDGGFIVRRGSNSAYFTSKSFVPADLLSRNTSTLYLPFGSPPGFEMWNSVYASPVGAIDCVDSCTTCPSSNVQRAITFAVDALPVVCTDV